jgi:hypothetical protein
MANLGAHAALFPTYLASPFAFPHPRNRPFHENNWKLG